jgi:hypothetical protein
MGIVESIDIRSARRTSITARDFTALPRPLREFDALISCARELSK